MSRVLVVAALLVVVTAGCGGSRSSQQTAAPRVPRALARGWEGQASAIAAAASAGDECHALQLATSLRAEVERSQRKVPLRLRAPLLTGVRALAARITCEPPATTTVPEQAPKPPGDRHGGHEHHDHHGHGKGDGGGGGD